MCKNVFVVEYLFNQYFNFVVVGFMFKQVRWDYVGIIKNQKIVGVEFIK